jgi:hypothetical protein
MSVKKSNSNMPSDDFTMTDGYNYGLDGFQFDTEYGSGVLDSARLPEVHGLGGLPDGIIEDPQAEMGVDSSCAEMQVGDLGEMLKEGSLAELGWLHGEQDPERLPVNPVDKGIEELEKAWGTGKPTDGIHIVPNKESFSALPKRTAASVEDLMRVVRRAMRRSTYGESLDFILREAKNEVGEDFPRIVQSMKRLAQEHGLAGNVFIREAAFPGLKNGRWKKMIRKKCAGAKYVIAEDGSSVGSVVGKQVVSTIPWEEAMAHYGALLSPLGYQISEGKTPQERLKKAFLVGPSQEIVQEGFKPIEVKAVDTITSEEAQKQFAAATPAQRQQVDVSHRIIKKERKKANDWIAGKVRAGLLSLKAAERLLKSTAEPRDVMKAATRLVTANSPSKDYDGIGISFVASAPDERETKKAWEHLSLAETKSAMMTAEMWAAQNKQARKYLEKKYVSAGMLSPTEVNRIFALGKSPKEAMEIALSSVKKKAIKAKKTATYRGVGAHKPGKVGGEFQDPEWFGANNSLQMLTQKAMQEIMASGQITDRDVAAALFAMSKKEVKRATSKSYDTRVYKENTYKRPRGAKVKKNSVFLNWYNQQSKEAQLVVGEAIRTDGLLTAAQVEKLFVSGDASPEIVVERAMKLGKQAATILATKATTENYKGHKYEAAIQGTKPVKTEKVASVFELTDWIKAHPSKAQRAALRWAATQMTEGAAGKELDDLLRFRLAGDVQASIAESLKALRNAHEGAAGFLYVDPHVYATKNGTKGCDTGASKHRANNIVSVLQMDRCSSCKFANDKMYTNKDGQPITGRICQKYNKLLVAWDDGDAEAREFIKQANIKASGASDAEMTASLFAPGYNPNEFHLGSATDQIDMEEAPEYEDVGDIFFGGGLEV